MSTRAKTGGRKAGTPNRRSAAFKESLVHVYYRLGGDKALAAWAKANPTDFYRIMSKLLPSQMLLNAEVVTPPPMLNDFEIARRLSFALEKLRRSQQVEVVQEVLPEAPEATQTAPQPITYPVAYSPPSDVPVSPAIEGETLENYRARMLTENTTILTIETYPGSSREQKKDNHPTEQTEPSVRRRRKPLL